ncbi:MAG: uroporphyrinogen-III synthase [Thermoproteota archaeon]|nr:uroporphyrinogen-III synthase [Thermoproteota archaeon]
MKDLQNKILAITRDITRNAEFIHLVKESGGIPLSLSTIRIVPKNPESIFELINRINERNYEYYIFMSSSAVAVLLSLAEKVNMRDKILIELRNKKVIALGPSAKKYLEVHGIRPYTMPEKFSSTDLSDHVKSMALPRGTRILIPRSAASTSFMKDSLSTMGLLADDFFLYHPQTADLDELWIQFSKLLEGGRIHALIFTSPSSVSSFCSIMRKILPEFAIHCGKIQALISIGPLTTNELKIRCFLPIEAKEHTIAGAFGLARQILANQTSDC